MSFRKRNVVVASPGIASVSGAVKPVEQPLASGTRPSPLDGRLTISTGTRSLDTILAGHAGLALGTSLLVGESGTTDFGGSLLRYYAAEGLLHGHHVHVLGVHEGWAKDLPGVVIAGGSDGIRKIVKDASEDRMKIAWRYERLGEFGKERAAASPTTISDTNTAASLFCHDFDLSKRLAIPSPSTLKCVPLNMPNSPQKSPESPFASYLRHLATHISSLPPTTIHRIVIPQLLSPAMYPPQAANPENVLQFLHSLRALLRKYPTQLSIMSTIPLSLYPRHTGLTRWIELLADGVLEIAPFQANSLPITAVGATSIATQEEPPQGMLKVHTLPVFHERGGGGGGYRVGDDMAFNLTRRKGLVIKPYSLPPIEGDTDAQEQRGLTTDTGVKASKVDIDF